MSSTMPIASRSPAPPRTSGPRWPAAPASTMPTAAASATPTPPARAVSRECTGGKGAEEAVELLDAERAEARGRGRSDAPEHQEEPAQDPEPAGQAEEAALREHAEVLAVGGVLVARRGGLEVREVAGPDAARLLRHELQD